MKVLPSAVINWPHTGLALNTETPKSPCSARSSQSRYCIYSGLSKPNAAFICAMTSGEASGGISMSIGIAGHDVHQAEHDQGHAEQDRDGLENSAGDEYQHERAPRRNTLHRSILPKISTILACPAEILA